MTSGTLYRVREGLPDERIGEVVRFDYSRTKDTTPRYVTLPDFEAIAFRMGFCSLRLGVGLRAMGAAMRGRKGATAYWRRRARRLRR